MILDLNKLENKLDEALSNETTETLNKFLNDKRMTNNKQQTAVEWFLDQLIEHRIIIVDKTTYQVKYKHEILLEQAKEMHRQQAINLYYEYERYVMMNQSDEMTFGQFYKQTYGGGNK